MIKLVHDEIDEHGLKINANIINIYICIYTIEKVYPHGICKN